MLADEISIGIDHFEDNDVVFIDFNDHTFYLDPADAGELALSLVDAVNILEAL